MADNNVKKNRQFLQGVAVVLTSLASTVGTANATVSPTPEASAVAQTQSEFVIAPAQAAGAMQFSHESHSSHDSHASHASHASHGSSSG
jgi:hypothetical protein